MFVYQIFINKHLVHIIFLLFSYFITLLLMHLSGYSHLAAGRFLDVNILRIRLLYTAQTVWLTRATDDVEDLETAVKDLDILN